MVRSKSFPKMAESSTDNLAMVKSENPQNHLLVYQSENHENASLDEYKSDKNLPLDSYDLGNHSIDVYESEDHSVIAHETENRENPSVVYDSERHGNFPLSIVETEFCLPEGEAIFPEKKIEAGSTSGSSSVKRKQLNALTLETKIQVLKDSESGLSHRQLAEKYRCGKTQIGSILKQKDELMKEWTSNANRGRKRKRSEPYEVVNQMVWEWYQKARSKDLPINGPILQAKAKEYAFLLEISSFSASNGWLDSFRRRHNIIFRRANSNRVCNNIPEEIHEWKSHVASFLTEYSPKDIYAIHETRLLFRTIPNQFILNETELNRSKLSGERLTLALCCNAVGEKETLLVISKNFLPWYLKEIDSFKLGIKWYWNKKAWLTENIFREFLEALNEKMKSECRKIILFTSEFTFDPNVMQLSHVSIKQLPSLSTSFSDPFDLGIENSFKLLYRKRLLKALITRTCGEKTITETGLRITVLQAIKWVLFSWTEIAPDLITKCFKMSVIMNERKPIIQWNHFCDDEYKNLCYLVGIPSICEKDHCLNHLLHKQEVSLIPKPFSLPTITDNDDSDSDSYEDEQDLNNLNFESLPLDESLRNICHLRELFHKFCSLENQSRVLNAVDLIETELEDIIVKHKLLNFL